MNQNLSQLAIDKALIGNWKEAVEINSLILKEFPNDVDALNRLAKAHFELGNVNKAKNTIKMVLKVDPYNPIALKCVEKWRTIKKIDKHSFKQMPPEMFLEEPGKTKIVHLIHPCDNPILAKLNCGDMVYEDLKRRRISIISESGNYIGKLPDDVSIKIKQLIKMGYRYIFAVKSINKKEIKIFIRETERPERFINKASFSADMLDYIPYTPPEMVRDAIESKILDDETEDDQETTQVNAINS